MSKLKQKNLDFEKLALKSRIVESKELLQEQGFLVIPPVKRYKKGACLNINELVSFFYRCLYSNNSGREVQPVNVVVDDRNSMTIFFRARKNHGVSKERALCECENIISTLIKNEVILNLDRPIMSTAILTQKWAIDRALCIINNESKEVEDRFIDKLERSLELLDADEEAMSDRLNHMVKVVKRGSEKESS